MAEDMRRMQNQPMVNQMGMGGGAPMMPQSAPAGRGSKMAWIILAVVVVVLAVFGFLFRDRLFGAKSDGEVQGITTGASSGYQAVFLTNGQVYFGKVSDMNDQYVTLNDIYYLQVTTPPLQGSQEGQAQQQQQQLLLVKLGKELHAPADEMKINRDQILFVEDMKEEGQVMTKIREYQKDPDAATRPQSTTPAVNGQTTTTPAGQ